MTSIVLPQNYLCPVPNLGCYCDRRYPSVIRSIHFCFPFSLLSYVFSYCRYALSFILSLLYLPPSQSRLPPLTKSHLFMLCMVTSTTSARRGQEFQADRGRTFQHKLRSTIGIVGTGLAVSRYCFEGGFPAQIWESTHIANAAAQQC